MQGLRKWWLLASTLFPGFVCAQTPADSYPSKPVTIVVPFAAAGSTYITAQLWSQPLSESLGRTFLLDPKPGAGGNIASAYVAKAAPDGHTLMFVTSTFTMMPAYGNQSFDTVKDFAPVSLLSRRTLVLVVTPSLPVHTFRDYLAYVKANPGKINWGTTGAGTAFHLAGVLLGSATGSEVVFVHYKGSAQNYADLMAGRVHAGPMSLLSALPLIKSGKVRPIAQLSAQRSQYLPDLPTIAESGVPGYDHSAWQAMLAPAGTPAPIVNKLYGTIAGYVKSPAALSRAAKDGDDLVGSTPEVLGQVISGEVGRWRKVIRENNIQLNE